MSAKRCLISWYDASGRPNEYRLNTQSSVKSKTVSAAPTISADWMTTASSELALDVGGGVARRADQRSARDPHPVELDARVPADEVDAPQRGDGDAVGVGGHEELREAGVGARR